MGGDASSGVYGLWLGPELGRGSSATCGTYGNAPLCGDGGVCEQRTTSSSGGGGEGGGGESKATAENFEIATIELWGVDE